MMNMPDKPNPTAAVDYKPVPPGYCGWACGTDANGECMCGESDNINPSMVACPNAVLVPTPDELQLTDVVSDILLKELHDILLEELQAAQEDTLESAKRVPNSYMSGYDDGYLDGLSRALDIMRGETIDE